MAAEFPTTCSAGKTREFFSCHRKGSPPWASQYCSCTRSLSAAEDAVVNTSVLESPLTPPANTLFSPSHGLPNTPQYCEAKAQPFSGPHCRRVLIKRLPTLPHGRSWITIHDPLHPSHCLASSGPSNSTCTLGPLCTTSRSYPSSTPWPAQRSSPCSLI